MISVKILRNEVITMKINDVVTSVRVYELKEAIKASGYPMRTTLIDYEKEDITPQDIKRCCNLVKATETDNAAHGQFLSGIIVSFDLTFSVKAWTEAERYRYLTFISSQSSMHRIAKFDMDESFDTHVDNRVVDVVKQLVDDYNNETDAELKKEKYLNLLYSCPTGLRLTARITTNYRCLRNIYKQRKDHRLPEWRVFCRWIETLPYSGEFLIS
jgi:hypothetical protein